MGLNWREVIIRCLENVQPRSRTLLDPEPSPTSPRCMEQQPETTADGEPSSARATEPRIAPEPEPDLSDQVREQRWIMQRRGEGLEESPAHCTTTEGECPQDSEDLLNFDLDLYSDMPCLLPSSEPPICPELSICPQLSACPEATTEVVPLSLALPVLGVTIWCVWAAHTVLENPGAHKFPPTLPLLPPPVISAPLVFPRV